MSSNVGSASLYEAKDQRTTKDGENAPERFHEGKDNSHQANDPKDERSIANRLAREGNRSNDSESASEEAELAKKDPTLPALSHGNKPSKGAQIDKEIQDEEAEILKKKGGFGPKGS